MGFINSFLLSYHPQAKEYVEARTNKKRETLLSKLFIKSSFQQSCVNNESSINKSIFDSNFNRKGKLSKEEIIAFDVSDIENIKEPLLQK